LSEQNSLISIEQSEFKTKSSLWSTSVSCSSRKMASWHSESEGILIELSLKHSKIRPPPGGISAHICPISFLKLKLFNNYCFLSKPTATYLHKLYNDFVSLVPACSSCSLARSKFRTCFRHPLLTRSVFSVTMSSRIDLLRQFTTLKFR
jgi:hypothetical protein